MAHRTSDPTTDMPKLSFPMACVTLAAANDLTAAALAFGEEIGFAATAAVVDATGNVRALQRADGAAPLTGEVAIDKAWTAAGFGLATHLWNALAAEPAVAPMTHRPRLTAVAGGYPLRQDGQLVGGLGVSGGRPEQDREAASRALAQIGFAIDV